MDRAQAERLRDRLATEHPDRETHSFILSEQDGVWRVAKVALPPGRERAPGPARPGPEPLHDHGPGMMPGGVSPWHLGG